MKNLGSMPLAIARRLLALVFEIWGPHFCGVFSGFVTIDFVVKLLEMLKRLGNLGMRQILYHG